MYEPLDLQTAPLLSGLGLILGIAGLAVVAHGMWRKMRYKANAAGKSNVFEGEDARWDGPQGPKDAGIEVWSGVALAVVGVILIGVSVAMNIGINQTLEDNVRTKYPEVVKVEPNRWHGYSLDADLELEDGSVWEGADIYYNPDTGEPKIKGVPDSE